MSTASTLGNFYLFGNSKPQRPFFAGSGSSSSSARQSLTTLLIANLTAATAFLAFQSYMNGNADKLPGLVIATGVFGALTAYCWEPESSSAGFYM